MLTNKQKTLLHLIPKGLGVDDAQRRVIQRNVGGFYSAADKTASHAGFAAVMAYYEDRAGGQLERYTPGFWAAAVEKTSGEDRSRLLWRIEREAEALTWRYPEDVNAFLASKKMSGGKYADVRETPIYWLSRLLQALIEMRRRAGLRSVG